MSENRRSDWRIEEQPSFVLHTYPWRETSLIVEIFSRDYGRLSLIARGAKRPMSQFRGMLSPFCPLSLSWSGKGEIKNLIRAEWLGTLMPLNGEALLSAFYINELLVRLCARADPFPRLFGTYVQTLKKLMLENQRAAILRSFELDLLTAIGYGLPAKRFIESGLYVYYQGELQACGIDHEPQSDELIVKGSTLEAMREHRFEEIAVEKEARNLLREMIRYYLGDKPLNTRRILSDLRRI